MKLIKADVELLILGRAAVAAAMGWRFAGQAQLETFFTLSLSVVSVGCLVPGLLQALALSGSGSNCWSFGPY